MGIAEARTGQAGSVSGGLPWLWPRHWLGSIDGKNSIDGINRQAQAGARSFKSLLVLRADLRPLGRSRHWRGHRRLIRQRERR
jgi:hypothetical protein